MALRDFRLTPDAYRRVTLIATVLLGIIIVTGGAVRLTDSGLGCPDWPTCHPGRLTPHSAADGHAMVEFVNRMFTGLVGLGVIVCVLGSMRRTPRRSDLVWLSWGLVAGVLGQGVLGGLTVVFELQPELVMAHFLASVVLLTVAVVLHRRAGESEGPARPVVDPTVRTLGKVLLGVAAIVLVTGTVVTATGPHGGDEDARRFDFHLPDVARIHGASVIAFLVVVAVTFWLLRRTGAPVAVHQRLGALLVVILIQAAIGYIQYFNDIPELLVGFHIAGATAMVSTLLTVVGQP